MKIELMYIQDKFALNFNKQLYVQTMTTVKKFLSFHSNRHFSGILTILLIANLQVLLSGIALAKVDTTDSLLNINTLSKHLLINSNVDSSLFTIPPEYIDLYRNQDIHRSNVKSPAPQEISNNQKRKITSTRYFNRDDNFSLNSLQNPTRSHFITDLFRSENETTGTINILPESIGNIDANGIEYTDLDRFDRGFLPQPVAESERALTELKLGDKIILVNDSRNSTNERPNGASGSTNQTTSRNFGGIDSENHNEIIDQHNTSIENWEDRGFQPFIPSVTTQVSTPSKLAVNPANIGATTKKSQPKALSRSPIKQKLKESTASLDRQDQGSNDVVSIARSLSRLVLKFMNSGDQNPRSSDLPSSKKEIEDRGYLPVVQLYDFENTEARAHVRLNPATGISIQTDKNAKLDDVEIDRSILEKIVEDRGFVPLLPEKYETKQSKAPVIDLADTQESVVVMPAAPELPSSPTTQSTVDMEILHLINMNSPIPRPEYFNESQMGFILPLTRPDKLTLASTHTTASSRKVARLATKADVLDLDTINVIGIFGQKNNRTAIVRLENGTIQRINVGSRFNGGRIIAISDSSVTYVKDNHNHVLRMK